MRAAARETETEREGARRERGGEGGRAALGCCCLKIKLKETTVGVAPFALGPVTSCEVGRAGTQELDWTGLDATRFASPGLDGGLCVDCVSC